MKEFVVSKDCLGNNEGCYRIDNWLREQSKNVSVVFQAHLLEGYRPVTEHEVKTYESPDCAMAWNGAKFRKGLGGWEGYAKWFVPHDFEFKHRRLTDGDATKRPAVRCWDRADDVKSEGTLLAVLDGSSAPYVVRIKGSETVMHHYRYCELMQ